MKMDLPMSRCAVTRPATDTRWPSGSLPESKPLRASLHLVSGVNLFWNGSMPLARSAASLARRCSISEFVSSIRISRTGAAGSATQPGSRIVRRATEPKVQRREIEQELRRKTKQGIVGIATRFAERIGADEYFFAFVRAGGLFYCR